LKRTMPIELDVFHLRKDHKGRYLKNILFLVVGEQKVNSPPSISQYQSYNPGPDSQHSRWTQSCYDWVEGNCRFDSHVIHQMHWSLLCEETAIPLIRQAWKIQNEEAQES